MVSNILGTARNFYKNDNFFSKIVFTIMVMLVFYVLLHIGLYIIEKLFVPRDDPILQNKMIDCPAEQNYIQTSRKSNRSIPIHRSIDKRGGIEFTWSAWVYLTPDPNFDCTQTSTSRYDYIFFKGVNNANTTNNINLNNGPGVYIDRCYEKIIVCMDTHTHGSAPDQIEINEIPIKKWVNVIVRCSQRILDVFINGTLAHSKELDGIPQQNYDDIYYGNFQGMLSLFRYYSYAVDLLTIQDIIRNGPNTTKENDDIARSKPKYLSTKWYINN